MLKFLFGRKHLYRVSFKYRFPSQDATGELVWKEGLTGIGEKVRTQEEILREIFGLGPFNGFKMDAATQVLRFEGDRYWAPDWAPAEVRNRWGLEFVLEITGDLGAMSSLSKRLKQAGVQDSHEYDSDTEEPLDGASSTGQSSENANVVKYDLSVDDYVDSISVSSSAQIIERNRRSPDYYDPTSKDQFQYRIIGMGAELRLVESCQIALDGVSWFAVKSGIVLDDEISKNVFRQFAQNDQRRLDRIKEEIDYYSKATEWKRCSDYKILWAIFQGEESARKPFHEFLQGEYRRLTAGFEGVVAHLRSLRCNVSYTMPTKEDYYSGDVHFDNPPEVESTLKMFLGSEGWHSAFGFGSSEEFWEFPFKKYVLEQLIREGLVRCR